MCGHRIADGFLKIIVKKGLASLDRGAISAGNQPGARMTGKSGQVVLFQ
jgi:hypothetical protein